MDCCKSDCGCGKGGEAPPKKRSLPVVQATAPPATGMDAVVHPTSGNLPSPIPWLGVVGEVTPLDTLTIRGALGVEASDVYSRSPEAHQEATRIQQEMERRAGARIRTLSEELGLMSTALPNVPFSPEAPVTEASTSAKTRPKKLDPKRPGSGIPARPLIRILVWLRRVSQAGFFALFLYFLFQTTFRGSFGAKAGDAVRL
ncbi:MAG: hypothetical protein RMJ98_05260, partial [Myxococcales bacterium]|nr:hypothetical protein [Polyangiaceae bacterium]MDW8248698.1 hypothetical protein [Myxococcales bacterium]